MMCCDCRTSTQRVNVEICCFPPRRAVSPFLASRPFSIQIAWSFWALISRIGSGINFRGDSPQHEADLELWEQFEVENPDTFTGMYQFWVQRKVDYRLVPLKSARGLDPAPLLVDRIDLV